MAKKLKPIKKKKIKLLPLHEKSDWYTRSVLKQFSKTSEVVHYTSDGTHGVNIDVKLYNDHGDTFKDLNLSCLCCKNEFKNKVSIVEVHKVPRDCKLGADLTKVVKESGYDALDLVEVNGVLASKLTWKRILGPILNFKVKNPINLD